jgi:hypothetical protein
MKTRSVGLTGIAEHLKCSERDPGIIASPVINRPCARRVPYKNARCGVYSMMRANSTRWRKLTILARAGLVFCLFIEAKRDYVFWAQNEANKPHNNPQDFFLWGTRSHSFAYSFRYDPRAADEWLFHSGGPHPYPSNGLVPGLR